MSLNLVDDLTAAVEDDVYLDCTPDKPALRYGGDQLVFLWDQLRNPETLQKTLKPPHHKEFVRFVKTKETFKPFKGFLGRDKTLKGILPIPSVIKYSEPAGHGFSLNNVNAQPIGGSLHKISLKGLTALDKYYSNTILTSRKKVIVTSGSIDYTAWVWYTKTGTFCKWDPHENLNMLDTNLRPQPVNSPTVSAPGVQRFYLY